MPILRKSGLFQRLQYDALRAGINPRTKESRKWFQNQVAKLGNVNRRQLVKEGLRSKDFGPGVMACYIYDPKTKKTLPYYDRFPLTVFVGPATDGFYGLNLHYLPPVLRLKLLDALMQNTTNKRFDEKTKFRMNYAVLRQAGNMKYYKPCFKHYLTEHVRSRFSVIESSDWEIAVMLPTQHFAKKSDNHVWHVSRSQV